jgi:hypothetical protein
MKKTADNRTAAVGWLQDVPEKAATVAIGIPS